MPVGADAGLVWVRIADARPDELGAAEALYREAFPAEQRMPLDELVAEDRSGAAEVWLVRSDVRLAALAGVWRLPATAWSYLGYLAVARSLRGDGIGAGVWRALIARLPAGGAMAFEIEHPWAPGLGAGERETRLRRLRFYTRQGARRLRAPGYVVPTADGAGEIPMLLMAAPGRRAAMPAGELRGLIAAIHRSYGMAPADPLTLRSLASAR